MFCASILGIQPIKPAANSGDHEELPCLGLVNLQPLHVYVLAFINLHQDDVVKKATQVKQVIPIYDDGAITGDQIELPSITTIKWESWAAGNDELDPPDHFDLNELREYFFYKAFLSSDSSTGSYIIVLTHNTWGQLSFARAGDDSWTPLPPHECFTDCVFKDELMYALTRKGAIHAFDFSGCAVNQTVVLEEMKTYMRESVPPFPQPRL
ncbi:hypothetical protein EJB05_55676, partial [Eragrostis curvula]